MSKNTEPATVKVINNAFLPLDRKTGEREGTENSKLQCIRSSFDNNLVAYKRKSY